MPVWGYSITSLQANGTGGGVYFRGDGAWIGGTTNQVSSACSLLNCSSSSLNTPSSITLGNGVSHTHSLKNY